MIFILSNVGMDISVYVGMYESDNRLDKTIYNENMFALDFEIKLNVKVLMS